jgi:nucleotide-binding universal stress UspA family protein
MRKGILVPFDGSENAIAALKEAANIGEAFGEQIIVLNVQPTYKTLHVKMFFSEKDVDSYQQQQAQEILAPAEEYLRKRKVAFTTKYREGIFVEEICAEADADIEGCGDTGVRYIVMGYRGMNPMFGGLLGSVSYGVLHHAKCPVHLVPPICSEQKLVELPPDTPTNLP